MNTGAIPIYGHGTQGSPLIGRRDPNLLLLVWMSWLRELGGSYEPMRDLSEPKAPTGRRDPDKRARRYELGEKYAIKSNGQVVRL